MHAHGIEIFQNSGLKKRLQVLPWESRTGRTDNGRLRLSFSNRFCRSNCQDRILLRIRLWRPKMAVRFVPDFPDDMASVKMFRRFGGPPRKRCDALWMLWRTCCSVGCARDRMWAGHLFLIQMMRI